VIRDNVPRGSVNHAFWIKPGIAYIKIEAFNETTSHEVDQALSHFGENEIEGLILDLRGHRVLLDQDLARLYGVATKRLNEAVPSQT